MKVQRRIGTNVWRGPSGAWHYSVVDFFQASVAHGQTRSRVTAENLARDAKARWKETLTKKIG